MDFIFPDATDDDVDLMLVVLHVLGSIIEEDMFSSKSPCGVWELEVECQFVANHVVVPRTGTARVPRNTFCNFVI